MKKTRRNEEEMQFDEIGRPAEIEYTEQKMARRKQGDQQEGRENNADRKRDSRQTSGDFRERREENRERRGDVNDTIDEEKERREERNKERREEQLAESKEMNLKYGALHLVQVVRPVSVCICIVGVITMLIRQQQKEDSIVKGRVTLPITPFSESEDDTAGQTAVTVVLNVIVLISFIAFMTFVIFFIFKFKLVKVFQAFILFELLIQSVYLTKIFLGNVVAYCFGQLAMDYPSTVFVVYNYAVVTVVCVLGNGPRCLEKACIVLCAIVIPIIFLEYLPPYTSWAVLAALALWDLFAVLAPCGPLKLLIKEVQARGSTNALKGLVYTTVVTCGCGGMPRISRPVGLLLNQMMESEDDTGGAGELVDEEESEGQMVDGVVGEVHNKEEEEELEEEKGGGAMLGLGDFIFYSFLVSLSMQDSTLLTSLACFIAILVGLGLTLIILSIIGRPLPALPISIAAGLIFFFGSDHLIKPFVESLNISQVCP